MSRYLIPIAFFALLIPLFIIGLGRDPTRLPSTFLHKPAPEFDLPQLRNPELRLSNQAFAGQFVLVNFWATWCIECRHEHAFLMQLSANEVIPVYGVNWRDNRQEAIAWLDQLGDPYLASGFDGENHTGIDWGVYAAPETFLIDPSGIVVYKLLGPLNNRIWQQEFVPRLSASEDSAL